MILLLDGFDINMRVIFHQVYVYMSNEMNAWGGVIRLFLPSACALFT